MTRTYPHLTISSDQPPDFGAEQIMESDDDDLSGVHFLNVHYLHYAGATGGIIITHTWQVQSACRRRRSTPTP